MDQSSTGRPALGHPAWVHPVPDRVIKIRIKIVRSKHATGSLKYGRVETLPGSRVRQPLPRGGIALGRSAVSDRVRQQGKKKPRPCVGRTVGPP
jgi:hypothetical protein